MCSKSIVGVKHNGFQAFPTLKGLENKSSVMSPKSKLKACQGSSSEGGVGQGCG